MCVCVCVCVVCRARGAGGGGAAGGRRSQRPVTGPIDPARLVMSAHSGRPPGRATRSAPPRRLPRGRGGDAASARLAADWARPVTSWATHFPTSGRSPLPLFQYFYQSAGGGLVSAVGCAAHRQGRRRRDRHSRRAVEPTSIHCHSKGQRACR